MISRPAVKHVLLGAILIGACLRLALAGVTLFYPSDALTYVQADNYAGAAESLRYTHDTTNPVFVPGYILIVAVCQACFGQYAHAFLLLFQCLIGVACIPMMFAIACHIGGEAAGVLTAVLVAIDPLLVPRSSLMMTEAFYIPLLIAALLLFVKAMANKEDAVRQWMLWL